MPLKVNGIIAQHVTFNGVEAQKVTFRNEVVHQRYTWKKYDVTYIRGTVKIAEAQQFGYIGTTTEITRSLSAQPVYDSSLEEYVFPFSSLSYVMNIYHKYVPVLEGYSRYLIPTYITQKYDYNSQYFAYVTSLSVYPYDQRARTGTGDIYGIGDIPQRGEYIEDVTNADVNAYPSDGVQGNYWYVLQT